MLFLLPFGGLGLPKFFGDFPVQAVHISLLEASADLGQPLLHSFDLALPERFLVGFIGEQGHLQLCQDLVRDSDRLQDLAETFGHDFFAEVR
ncbi:MAG: hypothetical protein WBD87_02755 [Candidatus Acidiferrales bacterium]